MSTDSGENPQTDTDTDTEEGPEENDDLGTTAEDDTAETSSAPEGGFVAGAVGLVGAALGLVSLTGTSLADKLHTRREIIGQIDSNSGAEVDQMEAFYSAPWNTVALTNGAFALLAVLVGSGVLLALHGRSTATQPWVKALALGGVILGCIGLLIAVAMNFDLFADQPELPMPPAGG
ncbi:hypothetical protein [Glycomyces tenuis]|nr:hypothetical protein [Glycomyces tenuis]